MHDEFERALGVRRRPGLSFLGWIGVGLLTLMVLGATGAFLAYRMVSQEVQELVERVQLRAPVEAPGMVARTVARTLGEMGTLPSVDEDDVASALTRALSASAGRVSLADRPSRSESADGGSAQATLDDDELEGFLRIRTDEGEIRAELRADDEGGRLVVRGPDDEVLVDLSGDARGARLFVRGEGEVAGFRTGEHAEASPAWLPRWDGPTRELERVLSGQAGDGVFGAETWWTDASPEAVIDRYRSRLEAEGWTIRAEHGLRDRHGTHVSVVGVQEARDRMAVLTAGREDGSTRVVLGWGEAAGR